MKHIKDNPVVAIAGEWFTAHGKGVSLGYFGKEDNCAIAEKLKNAFAEWIDNGHTEEEVCTIIRDINTASQRVAVRNGMTKKDSWTKHYKGVDMPHDRYVAYRQR